MKQIESPEIMLFLQIEVLSGSIYIATLEGRLLDELNGRITMGPEKQDNFLALTNVTIQRGDGKQEKTTQVLVNTESIQMAATASADICRGIGGKPDPKPYPFTEKVPVPVKIVMKGYEITGNMYRFIHQKVEQVLVEKTNFVALTDAQVSALANGKRWDVPFLAVNKEQILSLYEQGTVNI